MPLHGLEQSVGLCLAEGHSSPFEHRHLFLNVVDYALRATLEILIFHLLKLVEEGSRLLYEVESCLTLATRLGQCVIRFGVFDVEVGQLDQL